MLEQTRTPVFIDGLYGKLVEGAISYFFPSANLQALEAGGEPVGRAIIDDSDNNSLILNWLGCR